MRDAEILNCKIVSTNLSFYQECIESKLMYLHLNLEGSGWGCSFGGVILDKKDNGEFMKNSIRNILTCLKVPSWEQLPGTFIRAECEGCGGGVPKIGHLIEDRWYDFSEARLIIGERYRENE